MPTVLSELPTELLALIAEHLEPGNLRRLALVCRGFRDISETVLYRHVFFRNGRQCTRLLLDLQRRSKRATAIHSLKLHELQRHEVGLDLLPDVLRLTTNLRALTIEISAEDSDYRWRGDGNQPDLIPLYATVLGDPTNLKLLKRLKLHANGYGAEFWDLSSLFKGVFCHPNLEELTISRATGTFPDLLDETRNGHLRTPLKRLALTECNMSNAGLYSMLLMPAALEFLFYDERRTEWCQKNFTKPSWRAHCAELFRALRLQHHSLKELRYIPKSYVSRDYQWSPEDKVDFRAFSELVTLCSPWGCPPFEEAAVSLTLGPPNIKKLTFCDYGNESTVEDDEIALSEERSQALKYAQQIADKKSINEVNIVTTYVFTGPHSKLCMAIMDKTYEILSKSGLWTRIWTIDIEHLFLIPPFLFGEENVTMDLLFDSRNGGWKAF